MKRISAPKAMMLQKKEYTWIQKPLPGPHMISECVPISLMLKIIKVAETMKEVRKILSSRSVLVDGRIVTEPKFPVGFMDVISAGDKSWRVLLDGKGRIIAKETKEKGIKICRVENKVIVKKGKLQISTNDGRTLFGQDAKVGDCLIISLPEGKVTKRLPLEVGMKCFIVGGKHVGKKAVIEEIISGSATRLAEVKCNIDGSTSNTFKGYIFPIGDFKVD